MAASHLFDDAARHVGEVETAFLAGDLGVEHDLEQQIAQLRFQFVPILAGDGIGNFVGFLDGVRHDGGVGLFPIPRTTVVGIAQSRHHDQ